MRNSMKTAALVFVLAIVALAASRGAPGSSSSAVGGDGASRSSVWLVGGYFVNTEGRGTKASRDIPDSIIELKGTRIGFVGSRRDHTLPKGAKQIDLRGKYVVPGFVDNIGAYGDQSQASAYLYFGVTTVATSFEPGNPLRPPTDTSASPAPLSLAFAEVSGEQDSGARLEPRAVRAEVASEVAQGGKVLDVSYSINNDQLKVLDQIPRKGFGYTAELAAAHYSRADKVVNSLLHTGRYFLGLAPPELRQQVASAPFSQEVATQLADLYMGLDPRSEDVQKYSKMLATGKAYLVPTMTLDYHSSFSSQEAFSTWWDEQVQRYGITGIPNPTYGVPGDPARPLVPNPALMDARYGLERVNARNGAKYLVGGGASRFGTLPGVSYPIEMQLMVDKLGLTPRQALAAATTNFDEAFGFHSVGAIKTGYVADAVVLDKNPAADVRNAQSIAAVVRDGHYLPREQILQPR